MLTNRVLPVHLAPWRKIPCIICPHISQKEGPRKLCTLNRWGMSILNLSLRNCTGKPPYIHFRTLNSPHVVQVVMNN